MQILSSISDHLSSVIKGGNWTEVCVLETLRDVDHTEAAVLTPASKNTIAALVHHLSYWNRIMVERIQGQRTAIPEHNGFNVSEITGQSAWQDLINDLLYSTEELSAAILVIDETRLDEPILEGYPSLYKNIQGTVEHIHYHLGQIVMIKHLVKSRLF